MRVSQELTDCVSESTPRFLGLFGAIWGKVWALGATGLGSHEGPRALG